MTMPTWQLNRGVARLTLGGFAATLRVQTPHEGLGTLHFDGSPQAGHIQGVAFSTVEPAPRGLVPVMDHPHRALSSDRVVRIRSHRWTLREKTVPRETRTARRR